jgi:hypothetical protein
MSELRIHPYDPEAQALIVYGGQKETGFIRVKQAYNGYVEMESHGLQWLQIGDALYLRINCDVEAIENLQEGAELTQLVSFDRKILTVYGETCSVVAALMHAGHPLYLSPGFNLGNYLRGKEYHPTMSEES